MPLVLSTDELRRICCERKAQEPRGTLVLVDGGTFYRTFDNDAVRACRAFGFSRPGAHGLTLERSDAKRRALVARSRVIVVDAQQHPSVKERIR